MQINKSKVMLIMARRQMSMRELASNVGVSANCLRANLNSKSTTAKTLGRLAAALECDPAEIVNLDD